MNKMFKQTKRIIGLVVPVILLFSAMTNYTFEAQTDDRHDAATSAAYQTTKAPLSEEDEGQTDGFQTDESAMSDAEALMQVESEGNQLGAEGEMQATDVDAFADVSAGIDATDEHVLDEAGEGIETIPSSVELAESVATVENLAGVILPTPKPLSAVFPDPVLAQTIARGLKQGVDEPVDQAKLDQIVRVYAAVPSWDQRPQVASIAGLEYARNLSSLTLSGNKVTNLHVLSTLTNLKALRLDHNKITDIQPLQSLTGLTYLDLSFNEVSDVGPLAFMALLTTLNLEKTRLNDLAPLARLNVLQNLNLSNNQLGDVSVLRPLVGLRELNLSDNRFTELGSVESFLRLEVLNVKSNPLEDISAVRRLSNLREFSLGNNKASSHARIQDFDPLNTLTKLKKLDISTSWHVEQIPAEVLARLEVLDASNYKYGDITPFLGLTHLKELSLANTEIEDVHPLATKSWPNLTNLSLHLNHILDPTPLAAGDFPMLRSLTLVNQSNKEKLRLPYEEAIAVENNVKDFSGGLIAPNSYTPVGSGSYEAPNVVWRLPAMTSNETSVGYKWMKPLKLWNITVSYSGEYNAAVYAHSRVEFIVDDEVYEHLDVKSGFSFAPPKVPPKKEGHTFSGWYTAPVGGEKWNFNNKVNVRNEPLQLYAQFDVHTYKLIYIHHDEVFEEHFDASFGQLLPHSSLSTKRGHTLNWYIDQTYSEKWDVANMTMPAYDVTLYGRYDINDYKLTYIHEETALEEQFDVVFDSVLPLASLPEKHGYTLKWYADSQYTIAVKPNDMSMPDEDVVLYGRYEVNKYNVTYVIGEEQSTTMVDFGTLLVQPADPMKEGYTFLGWFDEAGSSWDFTVDTMPASDMVLYAQYEIIQSNVTYIVGDEVMAIVEQIPYGMRLTEISAPDKEGHVFLGWFRTAVDEAEATEKPWDFALDTMPASDLTLHARYGEGVYALTYDDGQGNVSTPVFVTYGKYLTTEAPAPSVPSKPFHVFLGWSEHNEEDAPLWDFEQDTMPARALTLYARYDAMRFNVRYNDLQGHVSEPIQVKYDTLLSAEHALPDEPEKLGHEFLGWYTTPNDTTTSRGKLWDFYRDTMPGRDLMLYARYENAKYTLIYDDMQGGISEPIEVPFGRRIDAKTAPRAQEREGYAFVGWYTNAIELDEAADRRWDFSKDVMPAQDLTLYARYRSHQAGWTLTGADITMYEATFLQVQAAAGPEFAQALVARSEAQVFNEERIAVYDTMNTGNGLFVITNLPVLTTIDAPGQYEVHIAYFDQAGNGNEAVLGQVGLTILPGADPDADVDDNAGGEAQDGAAHGSGNATHSDGNVRKVKHKSRTDKLTRSGGYTLELILLSVCLLVCSLILGAFAFVRKKRTLKE
jgi:internalin A